MRTTINNKGFILSFTVLVASIMLAIGLGVFNILIKEVILATAARDSQYAFYAADTGAECGLFYDTKQNAFPTSSDSLIYTGTTVCAGTNFVIVPGELSSDAATSTFVLDSPHYCAKVLVAKFGGRTKVESEGFNTCNTGDSRRLERALRIFY